MKTESSKQAPKKALRKTDIVHSFIAEKCTFDFKQMLHGVCMQRCCFNDKCSVTGQRCVAWQ